MRRNYINKKSIIFAIFLTFSLSLGPFIILSNGILSDGSSGFNLRNNTEEIILRSSSTDDSVSELWSFTTGELVFCSPALSDVDDDGKLDVIIGSVDGKMWRGSR